MNQDTALIGKGKGKGKSKGKGKGKTGKGKESSGSLHPSQVDCHYGAACKWANSGCHFRHPPAAGKGAVAAISKGKGKGKRSNSAPPTAKKTVNLEKKPGVKDRKCSNPTCGAPVWASKLVCWKCNTNCPPWKPGDAKIK